MRVGTSFLFTVLHVCTLVVACSTPGGEVDQTRKGTSQPVPTVTLDPTQVIAPGTSALADCAEVAPFAPGCLEQTRPAELTPEVRFVGIVPDGPVTGASWSPDGTHLAYAVVNPEGWSGVEVRRAPEFRLVGQWEAEFVSDLIWTLDGGAVLFVFDRGDTNSIGLARVGEAEWQDLLPGAKAVMAVSASKDFVAWLTERVVSFRVHCGTGCETLYSLDVATGDLHPLVNATGEPKAPYADVFATVYLFSPDQLWVAATNWGRGLPEAVVLEWPGPGQPIDLSASIGDRWTEAQSWLSDSLVFVAYPPGDPHGWPMPPQPDLYVWDGESGVMRRLLSAAFRAIFSPSGDRLAVLFVGEPRTGESAEIEAEGSKPHLGVLDWPGGRLVATQPLANTQGITDAFDLWRVPTPTWARDGGALAFLPAEGGLALMSRDGDVRPMLTANVVSWVDWGSGTLALLVGEEIWLVAAGSF